MRFTLDIAVHDRNHQNADGEYWSWRSPGLSIATLNALRETIGSTRAAQVAGAARENDLCGGLLLQGPRAIAFRFCWGDRDERGRPERIVLAVASFDRSAAKVIDPLACVEHPTLDRVARLAARGGRLPAATPGDVAASIDTSEVAGRSLAAGPTQPIDDRGFDGPLDALRSLAAGLAVDQDWVITVLDPRHPNSQLASGASIRRLGRGGRSTSPPLSSTVERVRLPSERAPVPESRRPFLATSVDTPKPIADRPTVVPTFPISSGMTTDMVAAPSDALSRWMERLGIALAALAVGLVVGAWWARSVAPPNTSGEKETGLAEPRTASSDGVLQKPAPTSHDVPDRVEPEVRAVKEPVPPPDAAKPGFDGAAETGGGAGIEPIKVPDAKRSLKGGLIGRGTWP